MSKDMQSLPWNLLTRGRKINSAQCRSVNGEHASLGWAGLTMTWVLYALERHLPWDQLVFSVTGSHPARILAEHREVWGLVGRTTMVIAKHYAAAKEKNVFTSNMKSPYHVLLTGKTENQNKMETNTCRMIPCIYSKQTNKKSQKKKTCKHTYMNVIEYTKYWWWLCFRRVKRAPFLSSYRFYLCETKAVSAC